MIKKLIQKFEFGFIKFNKIFIQLENQGIDHYNSNESMGFNDPKEFDDTQVFDDLNFNWKYGLS